MCRALLAAQDAGIDKLRVGCVLSDVRAAVVQKLQVASCLAACAGGMAAPVNGKRWPDKCNLLRPLEMHVRDQLAHKGHSDAPVVSSLAWSNAEPRLLMAVFVSTDVRFLPMSLCKCESGNQTCMWNP